MNWLKFWVFPAALYLLNLILYFLGIDFYGMDVILHFIGGACIAWALMKTKIRLFCPYSWPDLVTVTSLVMVVAVSWEIYEYILPILGFGSFGTLGDTLCDLSVGYFGGWVNVLGMKKNEVS